MAFIIFLLSFTVGLFLNLCIHGTPAKQSILLALSGCRHKTPFCTKILAVEILTCFSIVYMFLKYGISQIFIIYSIVLCAVIVAAFIDLKKLIVPNKLIVFLFIVGVVNIALCVVFGGQTSGCIDYLLASAAAGGLFCIIAFITGGKMGGGDIKLMFALGLCLGLRLIMLTIFLSFFIGTLVSVYIILAKAKNRVSAIAFVPFISIGAIISMLFGNNIIIFSMFLIEIGIIYYN